MASDSIKNAPIVGIDVLRLAAALMVMAYHFGFKAVAETGGLLDKMTDIAPYVPSTWAFTWWGWVGVQVFFTISGVVIAFSAASSKATPAKFVRGRVLRLWPIVLIASCLAAVVEMTTFGQSFTKVALLWAKTVFFHPLPPWLMGQFWTLGIEVMFYLSILILLWAGYIQRLPQLGAFLILLSAAYWIVRAMNGGHDPLGRITQLLLFQHGMYFGVGILLAARVSTGAARWHTPVIVIAAIVAVVQIQVVSGWEAGHAGLTGYWPMPFVIYVASVALIWVSLLCNTAVVDAIGIRGAMFIRQMGMMTFPLYLVHNHVGKPVILRALDMGGSIEIAIALAATASIGVAWTVAAWIEPFVFQWISRAYDGVARPLQRILS
ncbi:MAG: acyltransferase [Pseudomonadota bacterium]